MMKIKFIATVLFLGVFTSANAAEQQEQIYLLTFNEVEQSSCSSAQIMPEASSTAQTTANSSCSALTQIQTLSI